jgi:uncharacterized integral membrane protein
MAQGFTYGGTTILSHPLFVEVILPFILVFTIVFAVLEKSKIFGEGKKQIDAIVGLVVGLLVISFANAVGIILQLIPFLAVSLVVILVLMILLGAFAQEGKFEEMMPKRLRIVLMIAAIIALVIAVLFITGSWDWVYFNFFLQGSSSAWVTNIIFLVVIAGAIIAVVAGGKKSS